MLQTYRWAYAGRLVPFWPRQSLTSPLPSYFSTRNPADPAFLVQLAENLEKKEGLPAFLLAKIIVGSAYMPEVAQKTPDFLNELTIRRFLKWFQDALIDAFKLTFGLLDAYYDGPSGATSLDIDAATFASLHDSIKSSYESHFPDTVLPALLGDPVLIRHVVETIVEDSLCSPLAEVYKHQIGKEMEKRLFQELDAQGIAYMTEAQLSKLGYPKTPDALLTVPVALGPSKDTIVHWVESKAFFGNLQQHESYLQKQYWAYHNRYGPGLVIYWFGHVQELSSRGLVEGVLVDEKLPPNIIQIQPFPDIAFEAAPFGSTDSVSAAQEAL